MNDKEYAAQKQRVLSLSDKWIAPLGLKWWSVTIVYNRDDSGDAGDGRCVVANTTETQMSANIFSCKHCGHALGSCNDAELKIADVAFFEKVTMKCPRCGRMNYWRPALKINLHKANNRVKNCTA